jgi:excisionase family DNA binding protein
VLSRGSSATGRREMSDLTPQQAASELSCSRTLVYRLIDRGELPGTYELPGCKRKRIPRADLDALKERHRVPGSRPIPVYEPAVARTRGSESGRFGDELDLIEKGDAA